MKAKVNWIKVMRQNRKNKKILRRQAKETVMKLGGRHTMMTWAFLL